MRFETRTAVKSRPCAQDALGVAKRWRAAVYLGLLSSTFSTAVSQLSAARIGRDAAVDLMSVAAIPARDWALTAEPTVGVMAVGIAFHQWDGSFWSRCFRSGSLSSHCSSLTGSAFLFTSPRRPCIRCSRGFAAVLRNRRFLRAGHFCDSGALARFVACWGSAPRRCLLRVAANSHGWDAIRRSTRLSCGICPPIMSKAFCWLRSPQNGRAIPISHLVEAYGGEPEGRGKNFHALVGKLVRRTHAGLLGGGKSGHARTTRYGGRGEAAVNSRGVLRQSICRVDDRTSQGSCRYGRLGTPPRDRSPSPPYGARDPPRAARGNSPDARYARSVCGIPRVPKHVRGQRESLIGCPSPAVIHTPRMQLQRRQRLPCRQRKLNRHRIAGGNLTGRLDNTEHAAPEPGTRILPDDRALQPFLEAVNEATGSSQASQFDDSRVTYSQSRPKRKARQVQTFRRHVCPGRRSSR
jgi:hypothetical protein